MVRPKINLLGRKFGHVEVLYRNGRDSFGQALYACKCKCGRIEDMPAVRIKKKGIIWCGECDPIVIDVSAELKLLTDAQLDVVDMWCATGTEISTAIRIAKERSSVLSRVNDADPNSINGKLILDRLSQGMAS